jgi:hypothetical protein
LVAAAAAAAAAPAAAAAAAAVVRRTMLRCQQRKPSRRAHLSRRESAPDGHIDEAMSAGQVLFRMGPGISSVRPLMVV